MIDIQKINASDIGRAVEIVDRVWWVGSYMPGDIFQCNAYLIENGSDSVLIDPGGPLTFEHVLRKVEEVVPFSSIRYFVCHHQDPDITGSLKTIDEMPGRNPDAVIVTHWRAIQLIKHYALEMPFWDIDANGWRLDLGSRAIKFIFTPYLHFPGAFCTFDETSGTLFSSDIFGGMTADWSLAARDESYFEDIRPFHEHYMPSREILLHGLMKIEEHPVEQIAPQHGSIIAGSLVGFIINRLKSIDCGIYALANDRTDIRRLSFLNKALKDITKAMIVYRDFRDIAVALLDVIRRMLPAVSIEFYALLGDGEVILLAQETRFNGVAAAVPGVVAGLLGVDRRSWALSHSSCYERAQLEPARVSIRGAAVEHAIVIPLFTHEKSVSLGAAVLRLAHDVALTSEVEQMLEQMSETLGVAVEREILYRVLDRERNKFYCQSIRDPLTGLYNRQHMEDAVHKLMNLSDRNPEQAITLAMLDIDYFKSINDGYGHGAGDDVLKIVGSVIAGSLRASDLPVRYGGEEFAVFLVGGTVKDCMMVTERIREKIGRLSFEGALQGHRITVSAGLARRKPREALRDLVHRADRALYRAKSSGRDMIFTDEESSDS